ncbi:MAG TPA: dynamin family protein [Chloroflexota bacterium]
MAAGYETARRVGDAVALALEGIATLIGEPREKPVELPDGAVVVPGLGLSEEAGALTARARDLRAGLFTIIVVGEFKNGKSTLLNAMLGSKTLPAKAAPATAVITVLVRGEREDVAIFESGRPEPRHVSWEDFVREFQLSPQDQETIQEHGRLDRFSEVEYAELQRTHALCANGVKLVDSPGLGEHISRTRVALNFLQRSQAVILVLNATRILTSREREFVDTVLGESRLSHVFFVVNRIDQVDPASVPDIQRWVQAQLDTHFRLPNGSFDEVLYRRRVFLVNARAALEARSIVPNDEATLIASGVPTLERELEQFLTGGEKVAAVLQSTTQALRPILARAEERIRQTQASLDAPLEELEQRHVEAGQRLRELDRRKYETERTILRFGVAVKEKVYADLLGYVDEMGETWDEDSRRLMDLDRAVSLRNVITAYAQREARERMVDAIGEEVQRYVQAKFDLWSRRIPTVIERDVAVLMAEIEAQIDDLQLELDRISAAFAGTTRRTPELSNGTRIFHLALSLEDISGITDDVMSIGDPAAVLGRMVQQSIVVYIVSTLVTGSLLTATVLVQVLQTGLTESEVKKRIRRTLGERLATALAEQVAEKREFVYRAIEERFEEFARSTTVVLGRQIQEVRAEQERILRQKRDESFSVDLEKRRLDTVGTELQRLGESLQALEANPVTSGA